MSSLIRVLKNQSILFLLIYFLIPQSIFAQLELSKEVDSTTVYAGNSFDYTLKYRCASVIADCMDVVVVDTIPNGIEIVSITGTTHTINNGTAAGQVVTYTFKNPMTAGSTGDLKIKVRYSNGPTPNNTISSNRAWIMDATSKTPSNTVTTRALAYNRFVPKKTLVSGGAAGAPMTYRIGLCTSDINTYIMQPGTLNPTNVVLTDQLPAGTTILSISDGGTDNGSGLVTWNIPAGALDVTVSNTNSCINRYVTVQYDSPTFNVGSVVVNTASTTHTPLGGSNITTQNGDIIAGQVVDLTERDTLVNATYTGTLSKNAIKTNLGSGQQANYSLNWSNTGNVALENFYVEDSIPDEIKLVHFNTGYWNNINASTYNIYYKTNLNSTYQLWPGSPILYPVSLYVSNLNLAVGEQISFLKFDFGSFPSGSAMASATAIYMQYEAKDVTTITPTQNKITLHTTSPYVGNTVATAAASIYPKPNFAIPSPSKSFYTVPSTSQFLYDAKSIGDTVWVGLLMAVDNGGQAMQNPTLVDLLPLGLTYDGEWKSVADSLNLGAPTFTIIPNYNGTGREFLKFAWSGTPLIQKKAYVFFRVKVNNLSLPPFILNNSTLYGSNGNGCIDPNIYDPADGFVVDVNDINQNSSTTDSVCQVKAALQIKPSASLESIKLVKGQLDSVYSKYPQTGQTVAGGKADYKMYIKNTGNVPMKNIEMIDILPFIGDRGVIDPTSRFSMWRPNLADKITAPSGVTVYYSLSNKPCRTSLVPSGPAGCENPNWSTTAPTDITTVKSIRFDFGSMILEPGQQFDFSWPMRAPVDAPTSNEIAWNSFGFVATRTDNNSVLLPAEPIKVGVSVAKAEPGLFGNYVWLDTNHNGLQDEVGTGIDGVRVELFQDNGDNMSNPSSDNLVSFTVTGNGGLYQFPNLPPGNYYAVAYPPNTYTASPANNSADLTDTLDSDGVTGTFNGNSVLITSVTNITNTEVDFTWDFGIYPAGTCPLMAQSTITPPTCANNDGAINLTVTGQSNPPTFLWSSGQTTEDLNNISSGEYTVTVSDGVCTTTQVFNIQIMNTNSTYTMCPGDSFLLEIENSSLTNIQWFKDAMPITGENALTYNANSVGVYTYTSNGVGGCPVGQCCSIVLVASTNCCKPTICLPVKIARM